MTLDTDQVTQSSGLWPAETIQEEAKGCNPKAPLSLQSGLRVGFVQHFLQQSACAHQN